MTQVGRSPLDPWIDAVIGSEIEGDDEASDRRTLLVDGFNVLHTVLLAGERDSIWWGRDAREKLLARICAWPDPRDEIWVAFDGSQPAWSVLAVPAGRAAGGRGPTVHSIFVESADDWIVRRARRAPPPARALVVSADRKVAGRARSAGCEVWTPWAFVARCVVPSEDEQKAPLGLKAPPGLKAQLPDSPVGDDGSPAPRPPPNVLS
jgi:YacP-like NYN domain